jgi:CheY-like chemotaxis protein
VSDARDERRQTRVLILAPGGKDAALARHVLANANVDCEVVPDIVALVRGIAEGVGAVLVTEEAIAEGSGNLLALEIVRQPPWSDLPILVMTHQGADSPVAVQALQSLGNVTLLERPTRVSALVSAVRSALRARHRQHQTRQYLQERERTAAQLREADRRKDEFLATLAHELRNPLSPISNALEILRLSGNADPGAQPVLEMMERQVNHLVRLVDDLLDVSRITLGKMVLRRAPIAIGDVLETAIESSRPLIASRRHRLRDEIPTQPLSSTATPCGSRRCSRTCSTTPPSTPTSRARSSCRRAARARTSSSSVRDNGLGIPEEMLGRVFEIFAQVDGLQGARAAGSASASRWCAASWRCTAAASPSSARAAARAASSSCACRCPSPPSRARPLRATRRRARRAHRVLVVDDNVDAAESLGMVLDLLGAEVRVVNSGSDALATMASYAPTVVVLDIGMPGMDGYEVARRIRADRRYDGVTLIAMTGWGQDEDRRRTRAEGFDHHLIKPPDIVALQTVLASVDGGRAPSARRAR